MNGRQARKLLKNISVMRVRPGDTLVARVRNGGEAEDAGKVLHGAFPGVRVLVLLPGQSISVARTEERGA